MAIEVQNIEKFDGNDSYEYYYCLSTNKSNSDAGFWIKIEDGKVKDGKLEFVIDTRDVKEYEDELSEAENIYIYIKEVVTSEGDQKVAISNSMKFEPKENLEYEIYIDDEIYNEFNFIMEPETEYEEINDIQYNNTEYDNEEDNQDRSLTEVFLPNTGIRITGIVSIIGIFVFAVIRYINYKKLKEIK